MRVLIVNTSEKAGGAAVAANRLMEALINNGVKAKMLVRDKQTDSLTVVSAGNGWRQRWHFLWERWRIFMAMHFSRKHLFDVDIANVGTDITTLPEFKEADVIHLHWINQGFLSLTVIQKILQSGKPVVWTMHDIWPATGICHLTLGCYRFHAHCRNCKYLPKGGGDNDLSSRVWEKKQRLVEHSDIMFIACSKWLAGEARQSALLGQQQVFAIPNPIDLRCFHPTDKQASRQKEQLPTDKKLILFVSQRTTNVNKGMNYLIDACKLMVDRHPEIREQLAMVLIGGHSEEFENQFDVPVYSLGYINDTQRMVEVYNAVDLFVLPSLSENLPNTIMEAMACGVPCVGFKVGGIPEMIDHRKNGYVAEYRSADDLATGIHWVLREADYTQLASNAVRKVRHSYSQSAVASRYMEVYNQAMALKHYKL